MTCFREHEQPGEKLRLDDHGRNNRVGGVAGELALPPCYATLALSRRQVNVS
jgi:hypothetical protein